MQKLKVNDEVIILAGKDSGKKGNIKKINFKTNRVLVEGINVVKKAQKPTQESPNGGIVDLEHPVHISNIAVVSPKTGTATRVRIENKDGKKIRVATKCGSTLN